MEWNVGVQIEKTQDMLESGELTVDNISDPKVVVAVLLTFARDLPDDVVQLDTYEALKLCLDMKDRKDQERAVQCILVQMPLLYRSFFRHMVDTVANLAASSNDSFKVCCCSVSSRS